MSQLKLMFLFLVIIMDLKLGCMVLKKLQLTIHYNFCASFKFK